METAIENGITDTQARVSSHPKGKAVHKHIMEVPTRFETTASFSPMPSFKAIKFLKENIVLEMSMETIVLPLTK